MKNVYNRMNTLLVHTSVQVSKVFIIVIFSIRAFDIEKKTSIEVLNSHRNIPLLFSVFT